MKYTYLTKDLVDKYKSVLETAHLLEELNNKDLQEYNKSITAVYSSVVGEVVELLKKGGNFEGYKHKVSNMFEHCYVYDIPTDDINLKKPNLYTTKDFGNSQVTIIAGDKGIARYKWSNLVSNLQSKLDKIVTMDSYSVTMDSDELSTYYSLKLMIDEVAPKSTKVGGITLMSHK